MWKYLIAAGAVVLAGVPAAYGLAGNESFTHDVPVRVPSTAQTDAPTPTSGPTRHHDDAATDDHRGDRPRDDRTEPGDDRRGRGEAEPGDDRGGDRPRDDRTESGDDRGRNRGHGSDDRTDDRADDDGGHHGRHHGSDAGSDAGADDGTDDGSDHHGGHHGSDDD